MEKAAEVCEVTTAVTTKFPSKPNQQVDNGDCCCAIIMMVMG
jgi:hypothetical protein